MKSNIVVLTAASAGLLLLAAGCGRPPGGAGRMMGMGGPPEVSVLKIQPERASISTELTGRTSPFLVAEVRPQVMGIIQKRFFEEGSDVKEGDILYQIDPSTYQSEYDKAKAELARAEANAVPLRNKAARFKILLAAKAVSQQNYDDAAGECNKAEAGIGTAKAAMEAAKINLGHTRITAPISGRVGKSHVTVGALVASLQQQPLCTIQKVDPIYVDVTQSSSNLLRLKQEIAQGVIKSEGGRAKARLFFEDGSPYPLEGDLQFRDITVEQGTGSLTLRIVFPNPDHLLLPGMFVRASVCEGVVEQAILAPQQSVMRDMRGSPYALVVDQSGKVEPRPLEVDRAIENKWLVKKGLAPGDSLIVEGFQKIRPGVPVKAVPLGSDPAAAPPGKAESAAAGKGGPS